MTCHGLSGTIGKLWWISRPKETCPKTILKIFPEWMCLCHCEPVSRWVKELTKESSGTCTCFIILWMEEILHHLDGWNPKNNGINRLSTGADFFHPPYLHVFSEICMISCGEKDMVAPDWPTVAESGQLNFSMVAFVASCQPQKGLGSPQESWTYVFTWTMNHI